MTKNRADGPRALPRWFEAARTASIAIMERLHAAPPPPTLFHYTSTVALISIVRNDELWLSDATFLNDSAEIEYGRNVAVERLQAAINKEVRPEVRSMLELALAELRTESNPTVYVACFSLDGDDLAQWRGYGQGAAPIAIEFKHGPLMFGYTSEGLLQQVLYQPEEAAWTFDEVLTAHAAAYAEDLRDPRPSPRPEPIPLEEERAQCANRLYYSLWRYIVGCKHPAFQSEREVRFTYTAHNFSLRGTGWYPEHPTPMFRERAGRIVPYLSSRGLNFKNMPPVGEVPKLPICSVRIGPTEDRALIARGARQLLDTHDHKAVEITLSGMPLRPR